MSDQGRAPNEIVGGNLTSVGAWAPAENVVGVHLTPAFLAASAG